MDPSSAVGPAVEVVKCTCAPFARRITYLWKLEENMDLLRAKNEDLIARETDMRREIRRAEVQRRMPTERISALLGRIEMVKGRVADITRSFEESYVCFFSCSRLKLAKRGILVIQELDRLLQETNPFANDLVMEQSPPRAELLVAPSLVGDSTVKRNMDAILESLRNPLFGKIGIYAMGGSGKTSTMKKIHNQLVNTQDFDKIIWVTVSKDLNLDRVQRIIAEELHLNLSVYEDEERRAGGLFNKLKQTNKFLIIFDDVWNRIPLEKVGIPEPDTNNKCKIVLTTRSLAVCRDMESHKNIKLQLLSKEEAWDLFVSKAGNQVLNSELQPFAKEVVRQCGGLPLAINTVGRALRDEVNISGWRRAMQDLRISPLEIRGMEEEVYKILNFSYTRLRNDTIRKCFLYFAMFPGDYSLDPDEVIRFWMAERFIKEEGNLETERDAGYKIWKELQDACMIEENGSMHDCLRDLAINIMGEEGRWLVKAGLQLTESPNDDKWGKVERVSLMRNEIDSLCDRLYCPNLSTLLFQHNPLLQSLSSFFFSQMPALQVLDLSFTRITELPSSFSDLLNLRALFSQYCRSLKKIPSVAKLKKLWIVDLAGCTSLKEVPQGMEELTNLASLNLSGCGSVEEIPSLAKLKKLQILGLRSTGIKEVPQGMEEMISLRELRLSCKICNPSTLHLPHNIQTLHIWGSDIKHLSGLLCLRNLGCLKKCEIWWCSLKSEDSLILGKEMEEGSLPSLESLKVYINELTFLWRGVVPRACLKNLRSLEVGGCDSLRNLLFPTLLQHLKNIEIIKVHGCTLLEEIVVCSDGEGQRDDSANTTIDIVAPKLQSLILKSLPQLYSISKQRLVCPCLRLIHVWRCPKLKKLPFSDESLLSNLDLKIEGDRWEQWEALEWDDANTPTLLQSTFQRIY